MENKETKQTLKKNLGVLPAIAIVVGFLAGWMQTLILIIKSCIITLVN